MYRKLIYLVWFLFVLGLVGNANGQTGQILIEWWTNISGSDLRDLLSNADYPDNPTGSDYLSDFEVPPSGQKPPEFADLTDNYGARIRGYFHPPTTGDYTFWLISDDNGRLYLSPEGGAENKVLIARVIRWTGFNQWTKYQGQMSRPIRLEAGKKYYIEAVYKEGGGGDHLRVAYGPVGAQTVIPGSQLSPYNPAMASNANPADGSNIGTNWTALTWSPGPSATQHDVYFGDNYADVATAAADTFKGRQPNTFYYVPNLIPGTTYYWRIDEVDADGTIHTGEVWSFTVNPPTASNPSPADGSRWVATDAELSWSPGFGAVIHHVYFGTDETEVTNGTGDTAKGPIGDTTYMPGPLTPDTVYYWRIDEFDGTATHTGSVWRFRTMPEMPIYDVNLVAWWKLDDKGTGTVIDYSGYGHHGTIHGIAQFVPGYDGDALEINGRGDYVTIDGYKGVIGTTTANHAFSITAWIKSHDGGGEIVGWGSTGGGNRMEFRTNNNRLRFEAGNGNVQGDININDNQWHHVAVTVPEAARFVDVTIYLDGQVDMRPEDDTDPIHPVANFDVIIGLRYNRSGRALFGALDDIRIYDRVLTQQEIQQIMLRPDPRPAWGPNPADRAIVDIEKALPLSWSPGEMAAQHDVYIGSDEFSVAAADTSDTAGIYRGRQDANSYTPPEGVDFDQTYYWRIDEVNTDATITKGRVWSFTVGNFLIVDDFEAYDADNRIFDIWADYFVNNTGATVGYFDPPFVEQSLVHGGSQSMPLRYDNDGTVNEGSAYEKAGTLFYSEAERTWEVPQDWTRHGVKALTVWFRGVPGSVGSFIAGPPVYMMTADGADIWGTADQFHYAFKRLSGVGTITAKVLSVTNTHSWAKAGVMIRDTLAADSAHAMVVVTPGNGVAFQRRITAGDTSTGDTQSGITAPHWVKLERFLGGTFRAYHSTDGSTWEELGTPQLIPMAADVYVGLALTSHNAGATCVATFSDVTVTGTVTGDWQAQDIGIESNTADQLYVAVEDATGNSAVVNHEDPNAVLLDTWQEWNIDLKELAGVNLQAVKKLFIGVGDRVNPRPGGSGRLYIDDIWLYRPRCMPSLLKPAADLSNNCVVDYPDLQIMLADWLATESDIWDSTGGHDGKGCLVFDGSGDYVAIQELTYSTAGHPAVSVCAWIRSNNENDQIIASFDRNQFWRLEINGNGGGPGQVGWDVMTDTGQVDYGSTTRVDDGRWHHVVGVFDNGTLTIYIDGNPEPSATGGTTFGTAITRYGYLGVGSESAEFDGSKGPTNYFDGALDDFRIYDYALSAADVARLAAGTGQPAVGPILWYKLDETSGRIAHDSSGNGYDGDLMFSWFDINLSADSVIDLKDYAVLVDSWLEELLWPAE